MAPTIPEELKENGLYSVIETAKMMQVSRQWVYNMIRDDKLKTKVRKTNMKRYVTGKSIMTALTDVWF